MNRHAISAVCLNFLSFSFLSTFHYSHRVNDNVRGRGRQLSLSPLFVLYISWSFPFPWLYFYLMNGERTILVHVCCGPCATSSIERLLEEGWSPILFFSDSNIWPEEEFEKRYENLLIVAKRYSLPVVKDHYEHNEWLEWVKGLENEKEHGKRCSRCFRFNLLRTEKKAKEMGIHHFCTTLTVSRFKKSAVIFHEGEDLEGFEAIDFKKKDGFARSCAISKEMGLYRQTWCGCEFSKRESEE